MAGLKLPCVHLRFGHGQGVLLVLLVVRVDGDELPSPLSSAVSTAALPDSALWQDFFQWWEELIRVNWNSFLISIPYSSVSLWKYISYGPFPALGGLCPSDVTDSKMTAVSSRRGWEEKGTDG